MYSAQIFADSVLGRYQARLEEIEGDNYEDPSTMLRLLMCEPEVHDFSDGSKSGLLACFNT